MATGTPFFARCSLWQRGSVSPARRCPLRWSRPVLRGVGLFVIEANREVGLLQVLRGNDAAAE